MHAVAAYPGGDYLILDNDAAAFRTTTLTPFEQWQQQNFTPQQLGDPAISGPNADPNS